MRPGRPDAATLRQSADQWRDGCVPRSDAVTVIASDVTACTFTSARSRLRGSMAACCSAGDDLARHERRYRQLARHAVLQGGGRRMKARPAHGGFALIAALFLLVVLAALGAFAVRTNMTQRHDPTWSCRNCAPKRPQCRRRVRGRAPARARRNNCGNLCASPVGGFAVTFNSCAVTSAPVNGVPVNVYTMISPHREARTARRSSCSVARVGSVADYEPSPSGPLHQAACRRTASSRRSRSPPVTNFARSC